MLKDENIFAQRFGVSKRLVAAIAKEFDTDSGTILSNWRDARIVMARFMIARLLRDLGFSTSQIGKTIGGRHHATIIHSLRRFEQVYYENENFAQIYDRYSAMMKEVRDV